MLFLLAALYAMLFRADGYTCFLWTDSFQFEISGFINRALSINLLSRRGKIIFFSLYIVENIRVFFHRHRYFRIKKRAINLVFTKYRNNSYLSLFLLYFIIVDYIYFITFVRSYYSEFKDLRIHDSISMNFKSYCRF